jgi:8-oxo-dGTP diphosphatase
MRRNAGLFVAISLLSGFGSSAMSLVAGIWILDLTGSSSRAALAGLCVYAPVLTGPWLGADRKEAPAICGKSVRRSPPGQSRRLTVQDVRMSIPESPLAPPEAQPAPVRIVTAFLRDGNRVLLCHRSAQRRWYPDVWDLPGGHVEAGERPGAALARELQEELGIEIVAPSGPPMHQIHAEAFDMQIWLIESWTGSPANVAPDEHDAVGWFEEKDLEELRLAHDAYLELFTKTLFQHRP